MEEVEIWRAANQLIKQYPEDPDMVAAQRADAAYEKGDMLNFDLWTRITRPYIACSGPGQLVSR